MSSFFFFFFLFYLGFISPFMNHRTAWEGAGHFFNYSVPLPPASQTLRHQLGDYCRELTSAHSQHADLNQEPLVSECKSLTTKLCAQWETKRILPKRFQGIIQDVAVAVEIESKFQEAHSVKTQGFLAAIYLLKVKYRSTRTMCEICLMVKIKTAERRH